MNEVLHSLVGRTTSQKTNSAPAHTNKQAHRLRAPRHTRSHSRYTITHMRPGGEGARERRQKTRPEDPAEQRARCSARAAMSKGGRLWSLLQVRCLCTAAPPPCSDVPFMAIEARRRAFRSSTNRAFVVRAVQPATAGTEKSPAARLCWRFSASPLARQLRVRRWVPGARR